MTVFWDVMPSELVETYRSFGRTCRFRLHGRRVFCRFVSSPSARTSYLDVSKTTYSCPEVGGSPQERQLTSTRLHDITFY
jgi:hypothetical protein